ncbi:MAG: GTPase HflX [Acidobacteriota bacterium]|nr:GTPase HflX [Acidobacteriota bacterium]
MLDVVLIGIKKPQDNSWEIEEYLDELDLLVQNLDFKGRFRLVQKREKPDVACFVGSGMVEKIRQLVINESLKAVIFDDELSPSQQRNLEKMLPVPVYDRTFIILSIFSERAKTKEANAQVELARLKYEYPRLKKMWAHLHRQAGGTGIRGGEGEKQLEIDRRIARRRMQKLEKTLARFEVGRHTRKKQRQFLINIALVGYTNVGKSTLMNQLTKAHVEADNRLFVTLDATSRLWHVDPVLKIVLTDTVGFIRKLPHDLVASFRSTLTEVAEADLLFHVVDASHHQINELMKAVDDVIGSLIDENIPSVLVFNKVDALNRLDLLSLKRQHPNALFISAQQKIGLDELRRYVIDRFSDRLTECTLFLDYAHTKNFYHLGEYGQILHSSHLEDGIEVSFRGFTERLETLLRDMPELELVQEPDLEAVGESR